MRNARHRVTRMHIPDLSPERQFDLACLGRLAVDLYAQQLGARLEDVSSFAGSTVAALKSAAFIAAELA